MTELEKLEANLPFDFWDEEVASCKVRAVKVCQQLANLQAADASEEEITRCIHELFGSVGEGVTVCPGFHCDNGKNIHVGKRFLANFNVTILDVAPVHMGDYVMIGPHTLISTVNHPLNPQGRRDHISVPKPVTIGNDVWMGGNVTICPGVTVGNNVVIAAGAVVAHDVPDNCVVGGVPAVKIKDLVNDVTE